MDALKHSWQGTRDAFLQLPLPTRVISIALAMLIALGMWMVLTGVGQAPAMQRLIDGEALTGDEINEMLGAFSAAGLGDWDVRHGHIYVPSGEKSDYMAAVQAADAIPDHSETTLLMAQQDASPFDGYEARQSKERHAKEIDLGRQIAAFPQVRRAYVSHDSLRQGFSSQYRHSASVVVTPATADSLPPRLVRKIRELVSGAYAGMSADDVIVTDVNATGTELADEDNPLLREKVKWERWYHNQAREVLAPFGRLSVAASVELDPTMDTETFKLKYDPQATALSEDNSQITHEHTQPQPGGTPGLATNQFQGLGNRPQAIEAEPIRTIKSSQKTENLKKVTGEEYESSRVASLQPTRVSFSIGVPESYYEQVWAREYLNSNAASSSDNIPQLPSDDRIRLKSETKEIIHSALMPLLGKVKAGEDKYPLIEVWDYRDLPAEETQPPANAELALTWLATHWQTIAMILLALTALLVARSVARSAGAPRPDFEEGFGLDVPAAPAPAENEDEPLAPPRLRITGQHLKEELQQLVGANPEAAANVLRNWLDADAA